MLKIFSNFHDSKLFEDSLKEYKDKDISIFYDYPCGWDGDITEKLKLNPTNILILGEPNQYFGLHTMAVRNQYAYTCILTWSDEVVNGCDNGALFPFGTSWLDDEYIENIQNVDKTFEVSFLRGALKKTDGHELRHQIYDNRGDIKMSTKFFDVLDDYKQTGQRNDLSLKKVVWDTSMFHVSIENSTQNGYFTEKLVDAFLTKTIPIYWGCSDIGKYFDVNGMILIDSKEDAIKKINNLTEEDYHNRKESMDKNYKLALHYADFFGRVKGFLKDLIQINKL